MNIGEITYHIEEIRKVIGKNKEAAEKIMNFRKIANVSTINKEKHLGWWVA